MARSSYVYSVSQLMHGTGLRCVWGCFTVKYEMIAAVQRAIDNGEIIAYDLHIRRHHDGRMDKGDDITKQFVWRGKQ